MDLHPYALYASILLATTLLLLLIKFPRRNNPRLPPGPTPYPIIGNLNLMGDLPHQSIHALSKKYGPIMYLKFGSSPIIVGSSVSAAKFFLKTHDLSFVSRPRIAAGKYTTYDYADITWSPYGPYWRQARKICLTELFSARRLDSFEYIRLEELRRLLRHVSESSGRTIVLKDFLTTLSLNVISRMVLGKKYVREEKQDEFKKMLDELFFLNGVINIGDWIPCLQFLDLQGFVKRMKVLGPKLDRFFEHVLDEHEERMRVEGDGFVPKDMVDVLLQLAGNQELEIKLTRNGVKAFSQDIIAGGTESSAVTVEWTIAELIKRPEIFAKATEELDRVIGKDRWVEERDMHRLPYIESIIKETMRLHPVAPMLAPRMSREDSSFDGYHLPSGSLILVNVWTIGRDPEVWPEPDKFKPERFMGRDIDVKGKDFELLPFGSGRRMCPGYSLGLKVIQASLANILHGFEWNLTAGAKAEELNMEEVFGLSTPKKVPLEVVAKPRLPAHMYVM